MKMKRIAAVLAVALIGAQLMAASAMARIQSDNVCNFSGDELVIDLDALSGGGGADEVTLSMGSDDDDTLYCDSEGNDDDEGDLADIDKVTVLGGDNDGGEFELNLADVDSSDDVADFDGLEIEVSLDAGDEFFINGDPIDDLSVSTANQLHITVTDDSFSIPQAGVSGSYTNDPDDSYLTVYGGDDDDVVDISKAAFYSAYVDTQDPETYGRDVVYGMNTNNGYDELYADIVYPGDAGNGFTDLAYGYFKTSFANVSADLVAVGSGVDGGRWETDMSGYEYTLILGSGDDYFLDNGSGWTKVFGGAGDDALVGGDKMFGGRGNDFLRGTSDDDLLVGGKGRDKAVAYGGYDTCIGVEIRYSCEWLDRT